MLVEVFVGCVGCVGVGIDVCLNVDVFGWYVVFDGGIVGGIVIVGCVVIGCVVGVGVSIGVGVCVVVVWCVVFGFFLCVVLWIFFFVYCEYFFVLSGIVVCGGV